MSKSILVIGGGIVGTASALRLSDLGFEVTLIDPMDQRRGASFGNAGHIGAEQCDPWPSFGNLARAPKHLFAFGGPLDFPPSSVGRWLPWSFQFMRAAFPGSVARGTRGMEQLLADPLSTWQRLLERADASHLIRSCGHYVVYETASGAARGVRQWQRANTGRARFHGMTRDELARVGSAVRKSPVAGLRFEGTGQFTQPQAVRDALIAAFKARNGRMIASNVSKVSVGKSDVSVSCANGEIVTADEVLIAAGAWSGALMERLGVTVPLIAERGYHIQSARHSWPEGLPPVVFEERSIILSRFSDGLRMTSYFEFADTERLADGRKWAWLLHHVDELGIDFSKTPDKWMGSRPTLPDYLPAIGRLKSNPRVLYAFGHQHLGMTLAAVTAEWIAALASESGPQADLSFYEIERFK